jgi:cytochrome c-type biogenesis protein CcmH
VNFRALKRWPGWALLVVVLVALLAVGSTRDSGPSTPQDRIDAITKRLACPVCDGESVYESRATAAESIRTDVARQVADGTASDDQIVSGIEQVYGAKVLLVPKATGFDALVWAIPVAVLIIAAAGLVVAFRRWKRTLDTVPSEEDRELVAAALRGEWGPDPVHVAAPSSSNEDVASETGAIDGDDGR